MDLNQAMERLQAASGAPPDDSLREAAGAVASAVIASAKDGTHKQVGEAPYRIEEVTWPVSQFDDGASAFACPRQVVSLTRGDAVLLDVRSDYWDGSTNYPPVAEKVGRWRRFRMGSPGERGWDLHLATPEELLAFAAEAEAVLGAFGVGADLTSPAE